LVGRSVIVRKTGGAVSHTTNVGSSWICSVIEASVATIRRVNIIRGRNCKRPDKRSSSTGSSGVYGIVKFVLRAGAKCCLYCGHLYHQNLT
jgi:hypothetical protein